jgi:hypothetical protein
MRFSKTVGDWTYIESDFYVNGTSNGDLERLLGMLLLLYRPSNPSAALFAIHAKLENFSFAKRKRKRKRKDRESNWRYYSSLSPKQVSRAGP